MKMEQEEQRSCKTHLMVCHDCDAVQVAPGVVAHGEVRCRCCGALLRPAIRDPLNRSLALALGGLFLMIPANLFPVVHFSSYGVVNTNRLITGVWNLFDGGLPAVALLVLLTSIVFPIGYLAGMVYTLICARRQFYPRSFVTVLRLTQWQTRWGMVDVYLLACLVAFIKLSQLAQVDPGVGLYCLGGVLLCTLGANWVFDPEELWDGLAEEKRRVG